MHQQPLLRVYYKHNVKSEYDIAVPALLLPFTFASLVNYLKNTE